MSVLTSVVLMTCRTADCIT